MKKLFTAANLAEANHLRYLLARHGIDVELRNIYSSSAFGEIPMEDSLPQLWAAEDALPRAQKILAKETQTPTPDAPPWQCPKCAEQIEAVFAQCWNCGYEV